MYDLTLRHCCNYVPICGSQFDPNIGPFGPILYFCPFDSSQFSTLFHEVSTTAIQTQDMVNGQWSSSQNSDFLRSKFKYTHLKTTQPPFFLCSRRSFVMLLFLLVIRTRRACKELSVVFFPTWNRPTLSISIGRLASSQNPKKKMPRIFMEVNPIYV